MANKFEEEFVEAINAFIYSERVVGFAYRLPQIKYRKQIIDILVDSPDPRFFLGVECKSLKEPGRLAFSDHFSIGKDPNRNQILMIDDFLQRTGRQGYVAVEWRSVSEARLIPWQDVMVFYAARAASIPLSFLRSFPAAKLRKQTLLDGSKKKRYHVLPIFPTFDSSQQQL